MTSCLVIDCSGQVISVALARDGAGAGIWSETLNKNTVKRRRWLRSLSAFFNAHRSTIGQSWSTLLSVVVLVDLRDYASGSPLLLWAHCRCPARQALGYGYRCPHWLSQLSHRKVASDRPLICAVDTPRRFLLERPKRA